MLLRSMKCLMRNTNSFSASSDFNSDLTEKVPGQGVRAVH